MSSPCDDSPPIPVQPGERLADRYVVERILGCGAMGVVVAARHEKLGRTVAIKILTVSTELHPEAVDRFLLEARAAASLQSEHIARVMDAGIDDRGRHFIVMEYLDGEDLASVVRRDELLSVGQAVGYLLQASEALAEAHTQGIIHRDLKPENIFLTRRVDGSPLIKVLDFGISKMISPEREPGSLPATRSLFGSPLYMSPEQIRTPWSIDARSDVWALGVILFELVTGRHPFNGESLPAVFGSILTDTAPNPLTLRPDLPAAMATIIENCLEKDADARMPSAGALAKALHEWAPVWARDASNRAARLAAISTEEKETRPEEANSVDISEPPIPEQEPANRQSSNNLGRRTVFLLASSIGVLLILLVWLTHRSLVTKTLGSASTTDPAASSTPRAERVLKPTFAPTRRHDEVAVSPSSMALDAPAVPSKQTHAGTPRLAKKPRTRRGAFAAGGATLRPADVTDKPTPLPKRQRLPRSRAASIDPLEGRR